MKLSVTFGGLSEDLLNAIPAGKRGAIINGILQEVIMAETYHDVLTKELGLKESAKVINKLQNLKNKSPAIRPMPKKMTVKKKEPAEEIVETVAKKPIEHKKEPSKPALSGFDI